MTIVPKINNDSESRRLQRNMTDTQKRNSNLIKEGKLVNAFVKDPNLSLDETLDTLVISEKEIALPQKNIFFLELQGIIVLMMRFIKVFFQ